MKEVLRLLELKNEYLEKYLTITKAFVMGLEDGNVEDLELLKENRENIIGIVDHIDEKISKIASNFQETDSSLTESARSIFFLKEKLVEEIIETDAVLFELINMQKDNIVSELNDLKGVQSAFRGYENQNYTSIRGNYINLEK